MIYMSLAAPIILAENLVHEASHQYVHLMTRIEVLDDGSDHTLYFSPVTGRERPLAAILVAYHAFANVLLFLNDCIRTGFDGDGYAKARVKEVIPKVEVLESALKDNPALTTVGRALVTFLQGRLDQSKCNNAD